MNSLIRTNNGFSDFFDSIFDESHSLQQMAKDWLDGMNDKPEYVIVGSGYPKTNIRTVEEDGKKFAVVEMAVPGLNREDLEVSFADGVLFIKGNKQTKKEVSDDKYKLRELHQSSFSRHFDISRIIDANEDTVDIKLESGILTFKVQARETSKPQRKLLEIK